MLDKYDQQHYLNKKCNLLLLQLPIPWAIKANLKALLEFKGVAKYIIATFSQFSMTASLIGNIPLFSINDYMYQDYNILFQFIFIKLN